MHGQITMLIVILMLLSIPDVRHYPYLAFSVAAIISLWPVMGTGLDVASCLLPTIGFFSCSSLILIALAVGNLLQWGIRISSFELNLLLGVASILGPVLHATASGWTSFNLYTLGFTSVMLALGVGMIAAGAWIGDFKLIAILMLTALWAWLLNLGESQNLWDYLLDPWLVLYAAYHNASVLITHTT
ncbi:hypothetical protein TI04_04115 [Achromatium sp. WMS2]|nr:hypothetical protein TI04_04115 [Achromatium sp. WMS2]